MKIKAKKCYYADTWFRSNLEGRCAESFDRLGIEWEYEPIVARGEWYEGGQYTPDFYLPELKTYVEAAGVWNGRHATNALEFMNRLKLTPTGDWDEQPGYAIIDGGGYFGSVKPDGSVSRNVVLTKCTECGKWSLHANWVSFECPLCHAYDGDHLVDGMTSNLFDAAGVKRYAGR